jgi:hypothetical protein
MRKRTPPPADPEPEFVRPYSKRPSEAVQRRNQARERPPSEALARALRQAMRDSDLTPYALGQKSNVAASILSRFLNHKSGPSGLTLAVVERLAVVLDLELVPRERGRKTTD